MEIAVIITWIGMLIASLLNTPTTTIVLIENGAHKNAIVVETKAGSVLVDKPGQYVNLTSSSALPSDIKIMSQSEIEKRFESAISSVPLKPVNVLLYFKSDSDELTDESKSKLPLIFQYINDRFPCEVSLIGHTDTQGSENSNYKLSLLRAESIKNWIMSQKPDLQDLKVEGYGESDLLVETVDDVAEAKNRRVEIFIK